MRNDTKKTADLLPRVEAFVRRHRLYAPGETLLVALSGGKDSVCLLRLLAEQRDRQRLRLYAAHMHHGLRESAERDLQFCRRLCEDLGVELFTCRADVAAVAKKEKLSLEEAGRNLRYQWLFQLQQQVGAHRILTAHTASDQCETVLMRLIRGAAMRGLCAIPVKRGCISRPLLCVSSQEVYAYLRFLGQDWVEDETNKDSDYCRNRVRGQILPLLKEENPAWEMTLLDNTLALRRDFRLLEALSRRALAPLCLQGGLRIRKKELRALCGQEGMEGLAAHAVAAGVKALGAPGLSSERLEALSRLALEAQAGKQALFPGGCMRVEQEELVFSQKAREDLGAYEIPLEEGETELGPIQAKIRRFPMEKGENYKNINKMLMIMKINSATIVGGLIARNRKAGDRIQINGMNKSVRKLLCDSKLSADRRARIPVIADSQGILWVPGVGLCDRARPREGESFFTMEFQWNKDRNGDPTATVLSEYTVPTVGTEESDQQA